MFEQTPVKEIMARQYWNHCKKNNNNIQYVNKGAIKPMRREECAHHPIVENRGFLSKQKPHNLWQNEKKKRCQSWTKETELNISRLADCYSLVGWVAVARAYHTIEPHYGVKAMVKKPYCGSGKQDKTPPHWLWENPSKKSNRNKIRKKYICKIPKGCKVYITSPTFKVEISVHILSIVSEKYIV